MFGPGRQRALKTADGKIAAPPNYILLVIGIALVLLQVFLVGDRIASPVGNAALVALGVTLALYGIYPVSVMSGEFSGPLGKLAVAGPAAIGVFVFVFVFKTLSDEAEQRRSADKIDDVVLLTASATAKQHNSRLIKDETVRLLDVDSVDDDRISPVIDRLLQIAQSNGVAPDEAKKQVRMLIASFVPQLRLGQPYQNRAMAAVDRYLADEDGANEMWQKAVADAAAASASKEQIEGRVKRLPFATLALIKGEQRRILLVSEGSRLVVGGKSFDIPVIANPTKRYMPNLEEAVVLTASAQ